MPSIPRAVSERRVAVRILVALVLGACVTGQPSVAREDVTKPRLPEYVVFISIDGCRPEYLDLVPMPHYRELAERGTSFTGAWAGILMSNTPPAHTSMSTGSFPRRHHIVGFYWFDTETGERLEPTSTDAIQAGEFARVVRESEVPTLAGLAKAQDPAAVVVAVTSEKPYAAQGLGVGPSDAVIYSRRSGEEAAFAAPRAASGLDRGYEATGRGKLSPVAVDGHVPAPGILEDPGLVLEVRVPGDENRFAVRVALRLFEAQRPRVLFLNLPASDSYGHETGGLGGPGPMAEVMRATDEGIGRIVEAYRNAGILERTLFVVTSDHGMTINTNQIDPEVLAAPARRLGIQILGGKPPFWFLEQPARAQELADAIVNESIGGVVAAYAKIRRVDGTYEYRAAAGSRATLNPLLDRSYLYLLGTFASRYSPDVVAATEENTAIGTDAPNTRGAHNQMTWANQHVPLVLAGPGIRAGVRSDAPARLVDLAPTVARLMGWSTAGMDGVVLADALTRPKAADKRSQNAVTIRLGSLRDVLRLRQRMVASGTALPRR